MVMFLPRPFEVCACVFICTAVVWFPLHAVEYQTLKDCYCCYCYYCYSLNIPVRIDVVRRSALLCYWHL